jgi:putative transposase
MDNGPELISEELEKWARRHGIQRRFIQPGRPMQNGLIERFNRTYREEVLSAPHDRGLDHPLQRDSAA